MFILAVDTSTTSCSVALLENDRLMAEETVSEGKTHSRHLMDIIRRILTYCSVRPGDLDGIAVATGPGTFTGLRIGLSTVKGLAASTQVPVAGIGSLDALAYPLRRFDGPVVALIDARRGEVYGSIYEKGIDLNHSEPRIFVSSPETLIGKLPDNSVLVGSGALCYRQVFESRDRHLLMADPAFHVIRASSIGLLALARFHRKDVDAIETLIPQYVRPSDAQIQTMKKI